MKGEINNVEKWYIFYTAPRAEKVIYRNLVRKGMNVFLPLRKVHKIWKNRQHKIIEEPLFPSYIFVKTDREGIYTVIKHSKICSYINFCGKPAVIPDKDIDAIRTMLNSQQEITTNEFYEGDKVLVINGILAGYEGILCEKKGKNKFGIKIDGINMVASIEISDNDIKLL